MATTHGKIDGYAVVDDEQGLHQPITFATRLSPRGMVERVEIMVYREPRGDEVRDVRFRKQFQGKTSQDPLRLNRDIDAVSGATVSSASLAVGVRRATILVEELALGLSTLASAPAAAPAGERDAARAGAGQPVKRRRPGRARRRRARRDRGRRLPSPGRRRASHGRRTGGLPVPWPTSPGEVIPERAAAGEGGAAAPPRCAGDTRARRTAAHRRRRRPRRPAVPDAGRARDAGGARDTSAQATTRPVDEPAPAASRDARRDDAPGGDRRTAWCSSIATAMPIGSFSG